MVMQNICLRALAVFAVITFSGVCAMAADAPPGKQAICDKLLFETQQDDRDAFLASASPELKAAITQQVFDHVSNLLAPHLEKGFSTTYLDSLKKGHDVVYLWKVTFKDGYEDMLFRVTMNGNQVTGCFIQ